MPQTEKKAMKVTFDSCTEVVPCPLEGHGYIDIERCKACDLHDEVVFQMKSQRTGRDVNQVNCKYPAFRDVMKYMGRDGMEQVVVCPLFKSVKPLEECHLCESFRGIKETELPVSLKRDEFIQAVKDAMSGEHVPYVAQKKLQVQCGQLVGRQCAYVVKGARGVTDNGGSK